MKTIKLTDLNLKLKAISLSNQDLGKYGDGFEQAIYLVNEAVKAIDVIHCCKSDSELLCECKDEDIKHIDNFSDRMICKCGKKY